MRSMTETLQYAFRNNIFIRKNHVPIMQFFGYPNPNLGPGTRGDCRVSDYPRPDIVLSINRIQYTGLNLPLEFALAIQNSVC